MQCSTAIDKDTLRVAVEREIEVGAAVQTSAGYLHPACVAAYLEAKEKDKDETLVGITNNSRLPEADLAKVIADIG
jgi:hypothetical protein